MRGMREIEMIDVDKEKCDSKQDLCLGSAIAQPALNQSDNCITSLQEDCHRSVATGANMSFRMLLPGDNSGPESFESIFESSTNVNKTNFKVGEAR